MWGKAAALDVCAAALGSHHFDTNTTAPGLTYSIPAFAEDGMLVRAKVLAYPRVARAQRSMCAC